MTALLLAVVLAPWAHPLGFHATPGWHRGASGNLPSLYAGRNSGTGGPLESTAWIARGVRYVDGPTADPPNSTLSHLRKDAVVVWAVIYGPSTTAQPIRLDLARAKRLACCEATPVPAAYDLTGAGPGGAYSVIVRVYFGSQPTARLRAQAQLALDRLELPPAR